MDDISECEHLFECLCCASQMTLLSCTICFLQIKAIKDLGLNVVKGVVTSEEGSNMRRKKFLVTRQYVNWPLSFSCKRVVLNECIFGLLFQFSVHPSFDMLRGDFGLLAGTFGLSLLAEFVPKAIEYSRAIET